MSTSVFRKVSIDRLSSPEQLDALLEVVNPRGWIALVAAIVVVAATVGFGLFVNVPSLVSAEGVLLNTGSLTPVNATASGLINQLTIQEGDILEAGQQIASITTPSGLEPIINQHAGRVIQLLAARGNAIGAGELLFILEPTEAVMEPTVLALLPVAEVDKVADGAQASVTLGSQSVGGIVQSVSQLPINQATLARFIGSATVTQQLAAPDNHLLVQITLTSDHDTAIPSGTVGIVEIQVAEQPVWRYITQQGGSS